MKQRSQITAGVLSLSLLAGMTLPAYAAEGAALSPPPEEGTFLVDGEPVPTIPAGTVPFQMEPSAQPLDPPAPESPKPSAEGEDAEGVYADMIAAFRASHPGELEALDATALLTWQGYRDPMAAYMEDNDFATEEEALQHLLINYIQSTLGKEATHTAAEQYRQKDPESWDTFDADAWFEAQFPFYFDQEMMMYDYHLSTREELVEYLYVLYMEQNYVEPADPTVWVNGERLEVPFVAEDGVSYMNAATLNAILGTTHLEGEKLRVRQTAVEAGWGVTWNPRYNQIILLDRQALLTGTPLSEQAKADLEALGMAALVPLLASQDLSQLDTFVRRWQSQREADQRNRRTATTGVTLTTFNTLDGDQSAEGTVQADVMIQGTVVNATFTISAAALVDLIPEKTLQQYQTTYPQLRYTDLDELLTGAVVRVLWNWETGDLYVHAPVLGVLDEMYGDNAWLHWKLDSWEIPDQTQNQTEWDTGELLYQQLLANSGSETYSAGSAYAKFGAVRLLMGAVFGSDTFTETDGTLTWRADAASLRAALEPVSDAVLNFGDDRDASLLYWLDGLKEFQVVLSVDQTGQRSAEIVFRPDVDALSDSLTQDTASWTPSGNVETQAVLFPDVRISLQLEGDEEKSAGHAEYHWKNLFQMLFESESKWTHSTETLLTMPPADAEIVEM